MTRTPAWLVPTLFVGWLFFVLTSFFVVQKPFTAANAAAAVNILLDVSTVLWLGLVALGIGRRILLKLHPGEIQPAVQLVFGTALGLGLLGLLALGVGLLGFFNRPTAYIVILLLTIVALPSLQNLYRNFRRRQRETSPRPSRWTVLYLGAFALLTLLVALLPPTDWDGLFYHLTGPKLHLAAGRIVGGIDIPHLNFPSLMEMLFAWAMLLRSDVAAKLLHTLFAMLLAGLVGLITRRFLSSGAGWRAVLLLAGMPMIYMLAGWAYNDLALAFYQLAALYWVIEWVNLRMDDVSSPAIRNTQLIISGIFAGLAMGLKYTSFITPLLIVIIIVFYALRFTFYALRHTGVSLAAFTLPALITAAPWYLKNWFFTGNPVYPFLFDAFGGENWDAFRAGWYAAESSGIGVDPLTLLGLPWLLTLGIRDMNFWDGRTGPLLLLFLPLLVWAGFSRRFAGKRVPAAAKLLLFYALAHFAVWTLGVVWSRSLWQSRLLLPGLVALLPVAGWVWLNLSAFDLPRFSLSRFVNIAVGLTLALALVDTALLTLKFNPLPYLTGQETRAAHLERRLGSHFVAMQQLNTHLPPDAVVQFLWEPRSYYCQLGCRPDSILDTLPHLVHLHSTAEAIAQHWRQNGITHLLLHRDGLNFVRNDTPESVDEAVLSDLLENQMEPLFEVGSAYQVFAVR